MDSTLDYLTTALLITLVLFLAYLLYRRLLSILGKQDVPVQYASFTGEKYEAGGDHIMVGLNVPAEMRGSLSIRDASGKEVKAWSEKDLTPGECFYKWELTGEEKGRYVCVCTTGNQVVERYITLGE